MTEGYWIDPSGQLHETDNHAAFAYDTLQNEAIGDAESKKLQLTDDGSSVEWKGTGGAEAKDEAQKGLSRSPDDQQSVKDLLAKGWLQVFVEGNGVVVFSADAENVAKLWPSLANLMTTYDGIVFNLQNGSGKPIYIASQEIGNGGDSVLQILKTRSSVNVNGLGMWLRK